MTGSDIFALGGRQHDGPPDGHRPHEIAAPIAWAPLPPTSGTESDYALAGATDPVALNSERVRLEAIVNDEDTPEEVKDAAMNRVWEIRDIFEASPPATPGIAAVQIQLLKERMQGFEWSERDDLICENLIVGLSRMGAAV